MTKIDFHILPSADDNATYHYVARLANKARGKAHQVLIAVNSKEEIEPVSQALWSVSPDSFLAHTESASAPFPLQLTATDECGDHHDVLINLCHDTPAFFSRFNRVIEVVSQDPVRLQSSRARYRDYSDNGYPIERFDLRR